MQLGVRYKRQVGLQNQISLEGQGLPIQLRNLKISLETEKKSIYRISAKNHQENGIINDSGLSQRRHTEDVESALFT